MTEMRVNIYFPFQLLLQISYTILMEIMMKGMFLLLMLIILLMRMEMMMMLLQLMIKAAATAAAAIIACFYNSYCSWLQLILCCFRSF